MEETGWAEIEARERAHSRPISPNTNRVATGHRITDLLSRCLRCIPDMSRARVISITNLFVRGVGNDCTRVGGTSSGASRLVAKGGLIKPKLSSTAATCMG